MSHGTAALREHFYQQCEQRGLCLSATQSGALLQYLELLVHWQKYLNLTGIHNAERMLDVLIVESLDFLRQEFFPPEARVLDLGSGAGVPGIPLAICAPVAHFTLLDRSEKKMTFVRRVISTLHLHHSTACCSTVEDFARRLPVEQRFDVVVSRGVGTIAHLSRLAASCLRPSGVLLLRKPVSTPEIQEAEAVLAATGWQPVQMYPLLPASPDWGLVVLTRQGTVAAR